MSIIICVDGAYGDCGKSRIVDNISEKSDAIVRAGGGANAGHTTKIGEKEFKLNLIPAGVFRNKPCILGGGMVIDPGQILKELDFLNQNGFIVDLTISSSAFFVLPTHKYLDQYFESKRSGKIGTTGKGIMPAYVDRTARIGIPIDISDVSDSDLKQMVKQHFSFWGNCLTGHDELDIYDYIKLNFSELYKVAKFLDVSTLLNNMLKEKKNILVEGNQGTLLSISHGTYPYVTSSETCSSGYCAYLGVGPTSIDKTIVISKSYTTRVGNGVFPTERNDSVSDFIREEGREYGTVTGRPRRVGDLDLVSLKYACGVNGASCLAITKLDVLDKLDKISLCVAYQTERGITKDFPKNEFILNKVTPIVKDFEGWKKSTREIRCLHDLPYNARLYIDFISEYLDVPISHISVGPERNEMIKTMEVWNE